MYRRRVELRGFKAFVKQVAERFGGMKPLCDRIGMHFTSIYRRFNLLPWARWGKEADFLKRLAEVSFTPLDRVLWLSGYNPFVKREFNLSPQALDALWELNLKIVEAVKSGTFQADQINQIAHFALKVLQKEAEDNAPTKIDQNDGGGSGDEEFRSNGIGVAGENERADVSDLGDVFEETW